ncbi:MAG: sensor histidine kinase [Flavisolibacter sp.]
MKYYNLFIDFRVILPLFTINLTMHRFQFNADIPNMVSFSSKNQESVERFKILGDLLPYPIWLATPEGTLNYFNQAVYNYSGLKPEDLGKDKWLNMVHPDDRKRNIIAWENSVVTGKEFHFEHRFLRSDGVYRWHLSRGIPMRDKDGHIELWVGTTLDIQHQKMQNQELEEKIKDRTFELLRKNKELEQFAYVASHDMQEPLRKMQTFISILLNTNTERLNETQKQLFYKIDSAAFRLKNIIRDILDYSHQTGVGDHFVPVDLNEVVRLVETDLELIIEERKAKIRYDKLPVVIAVPGQMNQLFYNLIHNSIKFSKPGISPIVNIEYNESVIHDEFDEGFKKSMRIISVKDNGIGFDENYAEKIFGTFQRLHDRRTYKGSGIGLTLCRKIASDHKWILRAKSAPGKGTTIEIAIPWLLHSSNC